MLLLSSCPGSARLAPWYASMLGLGLAHRGREVTFIWDDTTFPDSQLEVQNRSIGNVLDWIGRYMPVIVSATTAMHGAER